MSFKDKVVIVTGASSGIGKELALCLIKEGAKVTAVGRNVDKLNKLVKEGEQFGGKKLLVLAADVTNEDDAIKIIEKTLKEFGRIDVLVNNAGYGRKCGLDDPKALEIFDGIMNTNLRAVVHLTLLAVPHLIKTKGNIVNVSSVASTMTVKGLWSYNTSKAGLDHFSRNIALELAPKGVRVNVVNPGPVETDFRINMGLDPKDLETHAKAVLAATPLGRISGSDEIADLIMFLMSDKARGITGSCFVSDNGFTMKANV